MSNDIEKIKLKDSKYGKITIGKDSFEDMFGKNKSYKELINSHLCTDGWRAIFDEWKDKGILN